MKHLKGKGRGIKTTNAYVVGAVFHPRWGNLISSIVYIKQKVAHGIARFLSNAAPTIFI
jgi:hypothetical protein